MKNIGWGLLAIAAAAGVTLWYFRKRDAYVSVEPVSDIGKSPAAAYDLFLPSSYTPSYIPLDINAPGAGSRLLQSQLTNPNPGYAATFQVP